jgi:hypothetical protein
MSGTSLSFLEVHLVGVGWWLLEKSASRLVIKQTHLNSLFELLDYKQIKQTKCCLLKCTNKSNVQFVENM